MTSVNTKTEKDLDNLLKEIKQKTGLTQEEIAVKIGYNRSYISQAKKTDSEKLYNALYNSYKGMLENPTLQEPTTNYGSEAINNIAYSNRILAEANKTLADAHFIISENNKELIEMAKMAFSFRRQALTDPEPELAKGEVEKSADELRRTGRTGAFVQPKRGKQ